MFLYLRGVFSVCVGVWWSQAWLLSVLGAQKDWRLALLRLGHLHRVGDQVVEADPDLSYAYYSNIARQTSADRLKPSSQQVQRLTPELWFLYPLFPPALLGFSAFVAFPTVYFSQPVTFLYHLRHGEAGGNRATGHIHMILMYLDCGRKPKHTQGGRIGNSAVCYCFFIHSFIRPSVRLYML